MELIVFAFFLLLLTWIPWKEGFDPFLHDSRPNGYPDQSMYGDIVLAEKYIQKLLKSPTLDKTKERELLDLLNLLQFI
jgi:hypothetical protein